MKPQMNRPYMQYYVEISQYLTDKELALLFQVQEKSKECKNSK